MIIPSCRANSEAEKGRQSKLMHLFQYILTKFSNELKVVNAIPVFKKKDPNNKANYRQMSLLPIISKIFERVLFEQFEKFAEKYCHQNRVVLEKAILHNS